MPRRRLRSWTSTVRSAERRDSDALTEAWLDAGRYYAALDARRFQVPDQVGLMDWLAGLLAAPRGDDEVWFVAERSGRVVGDVKAHIRRPDATARFELIRDVTESVLRVDALAVREADRRQGAGTALMGAVVGWGRRRGATRAFLSTAITSGLAVPFYESLRFELVSAGFWKQL